MTPKINKHEVVGKRVYTLALSSLEKEIYDLDNGDVTREEIARAAASLAETLVGRGLNKDLVLIQTPVMIFALGYSWKARNLKSGSWISCSSTERTGISRSLTNIFADPLKISEDDVDNIIQMMNEAWFHCENPA